MCQYVWVGVSVRALRAFKALYGGGGRGRLYIYCYAVTDHQSDSCIEMGINIMKSHFNVFIVLK